MAPDRTESPFTRSRVGWPALLLALVSLLAAPHAVQAEAENAPDAPLPRATWPTVGSETLELQADSIELETAAGRPRRVVASGGVRLKSQSLELRAPRLTYEPDTGQLQLDGGVRGLDGLSSVSADSLTVDTGTRTLHFDHGELRLVDATTDAKLRAAFEQGAPLPGRTRLTLRASSLSRTDGKNIEARDVWLSSCACELPAGPDGRPPCPPLISASAERARVVPGDVAELHGAWIRVFDLPVLPLPYVPLPLSRRKTGFLFPRVSPSGPGGVTVEQPFFLVLSEWMDLTLQPRWSFGNAGASSGGAGVRGPGLALEWRWTPAIDARGSLRVNALWDTSSSVAAGVATGSPRGGRLSVSLDDVRTVAGGRLVTDLELASDATLLRDLAGADLSRARLPYLPSRVAWSGHAGPLGLSLDAGAQQRLTPGAIDAPVQLRFFGAPALRATAFGTGSLGPISADAAVTTMLETRDADTSRLHLHISSRQSWPLLRGVGGVLALEAGERLDVANSSTNQADFVPGGGGHAGLVGRLHLSRAFGDWVHVVTPSVRLRAHASTGTWSDAWSTTSTGYGTEYDAALPTGAGVQAIAALSTELSRPDWRPARLDVAWHPSIKALPVELATHPFATHPGQLRVALSSMPLPNDAAGTLQLGAAWDLRLGAPASVSGRWRATFGSLGVDTGAGYYAANIDDQLSRPLDLLFTAPSLVAPAFAASRVQGDGVVSFAPAPGLTARASALLSRQLDGGGAFTQQYGLSVAWEVAGCARLSLSSTWSPNTAALPQVGLGFELGDVAGTLAAAADSLARR